jgi:enoyl-CoA hydratase
MDEIGAIVVTGKGKAFAAGADIPEMITKDFAHANNTNMFSQWADICKISKPIIAAVNGFALGGGCELAMMCDIVIASPNAKFGQPEVNLGIIPGAGGTQRLVRCIGKSKSMEMVLTGDMIDAAKAERDGLISKVVEDREGLVDEAIRYAIAKLNYAIRSTPTTVNW